MSKVTDVCARWSRSGYGRPEQSKKGVRFALGDSKVAEVSQWFLTHA
jgi:hypothetical protein